MASNEELGAMAWALLESNDKLFVASAETMHAETIVSNFHDHTFDLLLLHIDNDSPEENLVVMRYSRYQELVSSK